MKGSRALNDEFSERGRLIGQRLAHTDSRAPSREKIRKLLEEEEAYDREQAIEHGIGRALNHYRAVRVEVESRERQKGQR